jgi:ABC-type transporter Mla subunit MlaD
MEIYSKIEKFQNKTFETVTEKEVIQSEEDGINEALDRINEVRKQAAELLPELEGIIQEIILVIPSLRKRDLIYFKQKIESLHHSSKNLTNSLKDGKCSSAFVSLITEYTALNADLYEIISDIDKKTKGNKGIESVLDDLSDF